MKAIPFFCAIGGLIAAASGDCPDPEAYKISFQLVERIDETRASVRITGIVRNSGDADFISGPGQQAINLFEIYPGAPPSPPVATQEFTKLLVGETVSVSYTREWDSSLPSLSEFPPTYRLAIAHDPDILIDGNPANDDCRGDNNVLERDGADINDFTAGPWAPDGRYELNFEVAGEARRAIVHPAAGDAGGAPAVLYFHGRGTAADFGGDHAADSEFYRFFHLLWPEAYVIYAQGTNFDDDDDPNKKGWEIRFPHVYTHCGHGKDYEYVQRLLAHLAQTERVDMDMVFAAGHSSGGFFTLSLMELMPERFRAFAAVACFSQYLPDLEGDLVNDPPDPPPIICNWTYHHSPLNTTLDYPVPAAARPMPVLYMFGSDDIIFNGNGSDETNSNGYDPDCAVYSKSNKTLIELTSRNQATRPACPPDGPGYMTNFERQRFAPLTGVGVEVQFQLYEKTAVMRRGHSWPAGIHQPGNQWVINYFKGWHFRPAIRAISLGVAGVELTFTTSPGKTSHVLSSLGLGNWIRTGHSVPGNGTTKTLALGPGWATAPGGERFFAVEEE